MAEQSITTAVPSREKHLDDGTGPMKTGRQTQIAGARLNHSGKTHSRITPHTHTHTFNNHMHSLANQDYAKLNVVQGLLFPYGVEKRAAFHKENSHE